MSCCTSTSSFIRLRARTERDLPLVKALLQSEGLPLEGLEATEGYVLDGDGRILGHVALEKAKDGAVIRSLVVQPAHRGKGFGRRLLGIAETSAGDVPRVLRTEAIGSWVLRRGFQSVALGELPEGVLHTSEFAGALCGAMPVYIQAPRT